MTTAMINALNIDGGSEVKTAAGNPEKKVSLPESPFVKINNKRMDQNPDLTRTGVVAQFNPAEKELFLKLFQDNMADLYHRYYLLVGDTFAPSDNWSVEDPWTHTTVPERMKLAVPACSGAALHERRATVTYNREGGEINQINIFIIKEWYDSEEVVEFDILEVERRTRQHVNPISLLFTTVAARNIKRLRDAVGTLALHCL